MKIVFLILLMALSSLLTATARLGETEQEIAARFGEGTPGGKQRQAGATTLKYSRNGFRIEVAFFEGKSILEIYHKEGGSGTFPDVDIEILLNAYKELKYAKDSKGVTESKEATKRTWRFDRREKRWESSGKPKYIAYRQPGHDDFFFIKDLDACEALDKGPSGAKGF